jgi:hypothetical protein
MRTRWIAAAVLVHLTFIGNSGSALAFDRGGGGSSLIGDLDPHSLTKEDLRRDKPQPEAWQAEEATDTGKLETTPDEPSSPSKEAGGSKDRSIDPWP